MPASTSAAYQHLQPQLHGVASPVSCSPSCWSLLAPLFALVRSWWAAPHPAPPRRTPARRRPRHARCHRSCTETLSCRRPRSALPTGPWHYSGVHRKTARSSTRPSRSRAPDCGRRIGPWPRLRWRNSQGPPCSHRGRSTRTTSGPSPARTRLCAARRTRRLGAPAHAASALPQRRRSRELVFCCLAATVGVAVRLRRRPLLQCRRPAARSRLADSGTGFFAVLLLPSCCCRASNIRCHIEPSSLWTLKSISSGSSSISRAFGIKPSNIVRSSRARQVSNKGRLSVPTAEAVAASDRWRLDSGGLTAVPLRTISVVSFNVFFIWSADSSVSASIEGLSTEINSAHN